MLEYYVLNYNANKRCVEMFNIFQNCPLKDATVKELEKYIKSSEKYAKGELTGFDAFCEELKHLIQWQEWARREYEISVGDAFETDINKFEKWDCYKQCLPNIRIIASAVIEQYRSYKKGKK